MNGAELQGHLEAVVRFCVRVALDELAKHDRARPVVATAAPEPAPVGLDERVLWTVADVAKCLNVSTSWVYKESAAGRLPVSRIGSRVRFEPAAIRAWAAAQRRQPARLDYRLR